LWKTLGTAYDGDSSHVIDHCEAYYEFKKAESSNILHGVVYPTDIQIIELPHMNSGLVEQEALIYTPSGTLAPHKDGWYYHNWRRPSAVSCYLHRQDDN
jgi:hypothetical protein